MSIFYYYINNLCINQYEGGLFMSNEFNIPKVGAFEKVSYSEYAKAIKKIYPDYTHDQLVHMYDSIKLPERQTSGAAGYDFYTTIPVVFRPGVIQKIPTGIKCKIEPGWWLSLMVRSSIGTKHNIRFANTVPVIDSDYYDCAANEGHIFLPLVMDIIGPNGMTNLGFEVEAGERLCQGIFLPYGITTSDAVDTTRTGGFGSTTK